MNILIIYKNDSVNLPIPKIVCDNDNWIFSRNNINEIEIKLHSKTIHRVFIPKDLILEDDCFTRILSHTEDKTNIIRF